MFCNATSQDAHIAKCPTMSISHLWGLGFNAFCPLSQMHCGPESHPTRDHSHIAPSHLNNLHENTTRSRSSTVCRVGCPGGLVCRHACSEFHESYVVFNANTPNANFPPGWTRPGQTRPDQTNSCRIKRAFKVKILEPLQTKRSTTHRSMANIPP
jgi:hypothetical protein